MRAAIGCLLSLVSALACTQATVEPAIAVPCSADSPAALSACISRETYEKDVGFIAQPRPPGSTHWQAVQDLCAQRFAAAGFQVELQEFAVTTIVAGHEVPLTDEVGTNVIGTLPGTTKASEHVLVSAHYDHVPECDGADDNASGTAAVLRLAETLAAGRYARTLVVACWDRHEPQEQSAGLIGSRAYVTRAVERGDVIRASFVFEMIGFRSEQPHSQLVPGGFDIIFPAAYAQLTANDGRADFLFIASNGAARGASASLDEHAAAVALPTVTVELAQEEIESPALSALHRSDHSPFWLAGYPATLVTDTAELRNGRHHCRDGADTADTLDFDFADSVVRTATAAAASSLEWAQ